MWPIVAVTEFYGLETIVVNLPNDNHKTKRTIKNGLT